MKVDSVSVEFDSGKVSKIIAAGPVCVFSEVPGKLCQWLAAALDEAGGRPALAATLTGKDFQAGKADVPLYTRTAKTETVSVELVYSPPGQSAKTARYSGQLVYSVKKKTGR